jgi:hypothetical protein
MSEMIERAARIIDRFAFEDTPTVDDPGAFAHVIPRDDAERQLRQTVARFQAKRIITAMREPTPGMVDAGAETYGIETPHIGNLPVTVVDGQPSKAWRAMIDEALK